MGEIADAMLNGELCEGCGVFIPGEAEGIPRYCSVQCAKDRGASVDQVIESAPKPKSGLWKPSPKKPKTQCTICKKWVKKIGMENHLKDAHNIPYQIG